MTQTQTFIIGDVHGHFDRLEALLLQEGIIGPCPKCNGLGERSYLDPNAEGDFAFFDCENCHGDGTARIRKDVFVVQLGDLGHFGETGSPTGDMLCWRAAVNGWVDIVLWGNHDRAVVDKTSAFKGYDTPTDETTNYIARLHHQGRLMLAYADHDYLMTHAGLHASFCHQKVDPELKKDMRKFADWINDEDEKFLLTGICDPDARAIVAAIGSKRGGSSPAGGILWRDANEKLYPEFKQVFGHTRGVKVRQYPMKGGKTSYCVDIGGQFNGELAGIYLPSMKASQVKLND